MKPTFCLLPLACCLLSCTSTKPNVDLTITEGKRVETIKGRIPEQNQTTLSLILGLSGTALKDIINFLAL